MTVRQFQRGARITAIRGTTGGEYFATTSESVIIRDLRIQGTIDLTSDPKPNTCHVVVTNCSEKTRKFLEAKPLILRVDAGYDGVLHNFFVGDLRYGVSRIEKTDWETKLQLADGDRATRFGRVHQSYAPGTPVGEVLRDLAKSMNAVLPGKQSGMASVKLTEILGKSISGGFSTSGASADDLTRLLASFDLSWSFQGGKIQILGDLETDGNSPILVDEKSGMIESPNFGAPDHSKKPPHLTVKHTLDARFVPGRLIEVRSRDIKGMFKIHKTKHRFDTHGKEWTSTLEALKL